MNSTDVARIKKAIKAGTLAISAELVGSELEAEQAARTCGRLAALAGLTTAQLHARLCPAIRLADLAWNSMVDGWFDAAEGN